MQHCSSSKQVETKCMVVSISLHVWDTGQKCKHLSAKHFLLFLLHGAFLHATPWLFEGVEHSKWGLCWMKHPCLAECCHAAWASCREAFNIQNISCATSYANTPTFELFRWKPAQKFLFHHISFVKENVCAMGSCSSKTWRSYLCKLRKTEGRGPLNVLYIVAMEGCSQQSPGFCSPQHKKQEDA